MARIDVESAVPIARPYLETFLSISPAGECILEVGDTEVSIRQEEQGWVVNIDVATNKVVELGRWSKGVQYRESPGVLSTILAGLVSLITFGKLRVPLGREITASATIHRIFRVEPDSSAGLLESARLARSLVAAECDKRGLSDEIFSLQPVVGGFTCRGGKAFLARTKAGVLTEFNRL